ncbi:MAG TPA: DivIVA domain-containing protein [Acidimicrobiales bacterium]|nr:DivIVA domain-containing protein [Acidimicrobiales bacterium]
METKNQNPSFTVSLRGYDREEVDEYLDSLAEALEQVDTAEEHTRQLQAHINRLNARIKELEDRLSTEHPKSGMLLGERIGILLRQAEETAEDTVARAETQAAKIVTAAEQRAEEAEQVVRSATARGDEQGRRIEAAARSDAAEIIAEAEGRATARTRQIEQWAEQVISHTRAEEARMLHEQKATRERFAAEMAELQGQRGVAYRTLSELRDAVGHAMGIAEPEPEKEPPTSEPGPSPELGMAEAREGSEAEEADTPEGNAQGGVPAGSEDDDHFEEKLEAWVNWTGENETVRPHPEG